MRFRVCIPLVLATLTTLTMASSLSAEESTPIAITMHGDRPIRVLASAGLTRPCDSRQNVPVLDRMMVPGEVFQATIGGECLCIQQTSGSFPNSDWSTPGLICRPRVCHGRVCRPGPDPTIRVSLP